METAQIISTITERLGETPLSSRSISDIINANLPATGTEPDEAYFTNLVTMLKTFGSVYQGQHNHDTANARKSW